MALQSDRLSMLGLGVENDAPPTGSLQPAPLVNGVHLRWATRRDLGFPWCGFFLFRRPHRKTVPVCLSADIGPKPAGSLGSPTLSAAVGTVSSDANLVLTEAFAAPAVRELDLDGRSYVRVDRPPDEPAYGVDAKIGLRGAVGGRQGTSTCIDFAGAKPGKTGANPLVWKGATFQVFGATGPLASSELRPWPTFAVSLALVCGQRLRVVLPCTATSVEVTTCGGSRPATIVALDAHGKALKQTTTKQTGAPGTTKLAAAGIAAVEIQADPKETGARGLVKVCFICKPRPAIEVTAYSGTTPVASQVISGAAGKTVPVTFRFDVITSVRVTSGPASLVELCFLPVSQGATSGWQPLPGGPNPICLPVRHPDYPCSPQATNVAASRALALGRIRYGPSAPWSTAFTDLHARLKALVVGGPAQPMATRSASVAGVAVPPDSSADPPTIPHLSPLDLVLLGALHPAIAQMVGLYWADQTAVAGTAYDYLVVADHAGKKVRGSAAILAEIKAKGFAALDGFIAFGLTRGAAAPLAAPQDVRAYALPGTTIGIQDGTLQSETLAAGVRWARDTTTTGELLPGKPFLFHVWQAPLGDATAPSAVGQYAALTTDSPVLIAELPPGMTPSWPQDTPPFRLYHYDNGLAEGWYGYEVSGVDIFGRHSPKSAPAKWYQWAPAPVPPPWYYQTPASDKVIHPSAVRLLDKVPPPIPTGVEASALDPDDPMLLQDTVYAQWLATLSAAEKTALVGLRVRWKWTWAHMRQAPDTAEFRIYLNPGSTPPPFASEAVAWATRYYVVQYGAHVTVTTEGGHPLRQYEVIIPAQGDAVRASVPLTPSLVDPVVYANVGVGAADGRPHTADAPKWAAGNWGGRAGNEGRVGPAATIYRVWRTKPPAPVVPADSERVYASPADYHSRSFYTYRWIPSANLKTHVFRALEESVFAADLERSPRTTPVAADFPSEWDAAKQALASAKLTDLDAIVATGDRDAALAAYRSLSNDALRLLAGLPGNSGAFTQLTIQPLDPDDGANDDCRGPDTPDTYVPNAALRAYIDTLDGRTTSRYFYRAAYVDEAHNLGPLSLSGPPVYLPNVVPPRTPAITSVLGGDRQITLTWASNREPDLAEYRIYRAESEEDARDLRSMTLVHSEPVTAVDPTLRAAEVSWIDSAVEPLEALRYRVTAVDVDGNASLPSSVVAGRAFDYTPPSPPTWNPAVRSLDGVVLSWVSAEPVRALVQRREVGGTWRSISPWLEASRTAYRDEAANAGVDYVYRLRAQSAAGILNSVFADLSVPA